MKQCPVCKKSFETKFGLKQHMDSVHARSGQKPSSSRGATVPAAMAGPSVPRGGRVSGSPGSICITRAELLKSITMPAKESSLDSIFQLELASGSVMPWLSSLAALFDQYAWRRVSLMWKPAVATSVSGSMVIGMMWDVRSKVVDRAKVQALSPSSEGPLWQGQRLNLPGSRLQTRKWYEISKEANKEDKGPGGVCVSVKMDSSEQERFLGDLWMEYEVVLAGPTT